MKYLLSIIIIISACLSACGQKSKSNKAMSFKVQKTEAEWKKSLTPEEFRVLREKGTERAFTGKFYQHKEKGTYVCAACNNELFSSKTKFESGTGWPSYYDVLEGGVVTKTDRSYGMVRTEVLCANCGSHLGHVFEDGPNPTGLRYCINSISLGFKEN
ncbi:MAG: peptide-methionine (R)-S-oxide reductase MsrB [Thermonemataceae bacterium]